MKTEKIDHVKEKWLYFAAGTGMLALLYAIFLPVFDTNDDAGMMHIVDGSYGFSDPHLIYQHIFLGHLYRLLYRLNGSLPWYTLFQLAVIVVSLGVIGWCLRRRFDRVQTWVIYILILLIIGYEGFVQIQFTKTAGIAAAAGMALLLLFYTKEAGGKAAVAGYALLALGFMIRYQEALIVAALSGPAFIGALRTEKGRRGRSVKRLLIIAVSAMMLCGTLRGIDKMSYQSDEWQSYMAFNRVRSKLLDGGLPHFEENREAYEALGIDVYAFNMFRGWSFADPEVFTVEALQGIRDLQVDSRNYLDREKLRYYLTVEPKKILRSIPAAYLFVAAAAIALVLGCIRRKEMACLLLMGTAFALIYYYLYMRGKDLSARVDTPLFLAMALGTLFVCTNRRHSVRNEKEKGRSAGRRGVTGSIISLAIAAVTCGWMFHHATDAERPILRSSTEAQEVLASRERNRKVLEITAADSEHTYISRLDDISADRAFGPFDTAPQGILSNVLWTGGWSTWSPMYVRLMESHGITNPMRDFIDNEQIYLADSAREILKGYLAVHTGKTVTYEEVSAEETGIERIVICLVHSEAE